MQLPEEGIFSRLLSVDHHRLSGPGKIPNGFLKRSEKLLFKNLFRIFLRSPSFSVIPEEWKIANIVPVFQSGDDGLVNNYGSISLTRSCDKLLQHLICKRIRTFLSKHAVALRPATLV